MTIDKAIKSLIKELSMIYGIGTQKRIDAVKLGIEALKYLKARRAGSHVLPYHLLPGETKE